MPIAAFQLTQAKLVDMVLEIQKGMLVALQTGRLKDAGTLRPEQISFGKLNNVRDAIAICREARTDPRVATASPWSTRRCGTPTTWRACAPTRAPTRCTP